MNHASPSLQSLLSQPGISVRTIGDTPIEQRHIAASIAKTGGNIKKMAASSFIVLGVAAVISLSASKAHALEEFQPSSSVQSHAQPANARNTNNAPAPKVYTRENTSQYSAVTIVESSGSRKTGRGSGGASFQDSEPSYQQSSDIRSYDTSGMPAFTGGKDVEAFFLDPTKGNDPFIALATRMENLVTTIYQDPAGGRNIGIGYNIDAIGPAQAWKDFATIGMNPAHIAILKKGDASQYGQVRITPNQAVSLLFLTKPRYEGIARDWLGASHWDKLIINKKASVTYLAYQTGGRIEQFQKTRSLIRSGDNQEAQKHLVTYYKPTDDPSEKMKKNTRFEKHVGAMWAGSAVYARNVGLGEIANKLDAFGKPGGTAYASNSENYNTPSQPSQNTKNQTISGKPQPAAQLDISDDDAADIAILNGLKKEIAQLDAVILQLQRKPPSISNSLDSIGNNMRGAGGAPTPPPLRQITYK